MLAKKLLYPAAFALAVGFTTGCQVTPAPEPPPDPIAELRAVAEEAMRTANTAAYDAATAKDMAFTAQTAAGSAQETADEALQSAYDAIACCDANARRMNRMFHDSMKSK